MRSSPLRRAIELLVPVLAPCLLLAAAAFLVLAFGGFSTQTTAVTALINVMIVVGMYVFVGNSGIVSFGHVGFVAVGAYTVALLTIPTNMKSFLFPNLPGYIHFIGHTHLGAISGGLIAAGFTALVAAVIGFPLMRLSAFQAGMATLSLLIIIYVVISSWQSVTGGTNTMVGVPNHSTLRTTLVVTLLTVVAAYLYQISTPGLRLRASREDQFAARAIGVNVVIERWIAFALSAFLVGCAGVMYAYFIPFSTSSFYLPLTFLTIAMLIVGGRNSLWGAVTGSMLISFLSEVFRRIESGTSVAGVHIKIPSGSTELLIALTMLVVLILRPDGLTGGKEVTVASLRRLRIRRRRPGHADDQQAAQAADRAA
jgi:branched-chain amino acid transport system permease protein